MHLRKLPSGRWRAIVQHDGQKASVTADTQREAKRLAAQKLLELGGRPDDDVTVAELLNMHLRRNADRLAPTTMELYTSIVAKLPDQFLARRVVEVEARTLMGLYDQLLDGGMSPHTVTRLHSMLGSAWSNAVNWEMAARNPVRFVSAPKTDRQELHIPTPADIGVLLDGCEMPAHRLFIRLASTTGARRGELVALQWADINLEAGQIVVRRSVSETKSLGRSVRDTKTGAKGHRVIAIGVGLCGELRRWRAHQVERALASGLPEPVWVLSHDAGVSGWRPDYVTGWFGKLRSQVGVKCRLHDLRHFAATQLLAAGVPLSQVAGRLGHANVTTTARTYAHFVQADDRQAADIMDRLLG